LAATHCKEDEIVETCCYPYCEPAPEYYELCGQCCGDGKEPEYHERTGRLLGYNPCGNCGGDGKSYLKEG